MMHSDLQSGVECPCCARNATHNTAVQFCFFFFLVLLFVENPKMTMAVAQALAPVLPCLFAHRLPSSWEQCYLQEVAVNEGFFKCFRLVTHKSGRVLSESICFCHFQSLSFSVFLLFHTFWAHCVLCLSSALGKMKRSGKSQTKD